MPKVMLASIKEEEEQYQDQHFLTGLAFLDSSQTLFSKREEDFEKREIIWLKIKENNINKIKIKTIFYGVK